MNTEWHFCDFLEQKDVYALYLCWRACGYDRWDSLYNALQRYVPANWAFLYDNE